jgi:hypothetical protein
MSKVHIPEGDVLSSHCHKQFLPFYSNFSLDYYILYLTLIHLPPLRFYYVGEDAGIEPRIVATFGIWQLDTLNTRLDLIHIRLDLIYTRLDLIHARRDLIQTRLDLITFG